MDLALNNLQRLICHKTQQIKPIIYYCNADVRKLTKTIEYLPLSLMFATQCSVNLFYSHLHYECQMFLKYLIIFSGSE